MYVLLGISLSLGALLACNIGGSLISTAIWRSIKPWAMRWAPRERARLLFALRVLPPSFASICAFGLIAPAYVAYEPRNSAEPVSLELAVIASISALVILLALQRSAKSAIATRRLIDNWMKSSTRIKTLRLGRNSATTYRLRHSFPVVAVTGVFRPRIFIADQLFCELSEEELSAAIFHELGHLNSLDNLKRPALRICRDLLGFLPFCRGIDKAWAEASEAAADDYAATLRSEAALDLASALVKIARLSPPGSFAATPAMASLISDDLSGIAGRVRRLTQIASSDDIESRTGAFNSRMGAGMLIAAAALISLAAIYSPHPLYSIHQLIEFAVFYLQ